MGEDGAEGRRGVSQRTFFITVAALVVLMSAAGLLYNQSQSVTEQHRTLQDSYDSLLNQYDALQVNYGNLTNQYDALLSNHNALLGTPGLTYDITRFGAVPDDVNDDITAFQRILSAHPSNVRIRVPSGTFLLSKAIYLNNNDNVTLLGEGVGSVIKLTSQDSMIRIENSENVAIRDLTLDGNSARITGTEECIRAGFHADNLLLQNVYIHDAAGSGVHVFASSNTIISNCRVENAGKMGINSHFAGFGIILNSVDGSLITNNIVNEFFGDSGIGVTGGISGFPGRNAVISGNRISGAHTDEGAGIGIGLAESCIIVDNIIHDDEYLYDSKDDVFQGICGIYLMGEKNIVIDNNEVYRVTGVGIEINSGANVIAIDNHVHDFLGNGVNAQGIFVCADNTLIENNTIEDATNHGILTGEVGTNIQIIKNIIKDTRGVIYEDSAGIRIILDGDKKYFTVRDNTLINNPYGFYLSGTGKLIDSAITGNTITGSEITYFGLSPTN